MHRPAAGGVRAHVADTRHTVLTSLHCASTCARTRLSGVRGQISARSPGRPHCLSSCRLFGRPPVTGSSPANRAAPDSLAQPTCPWPWKSPHWWPGVGPRWWPS